MKSKGNGNGKGKGRRVKGKKRGREKGKGKEKRGKEKEKRKEKEKGKGKGRWKKDSLRNVGCTDTKVILYSVQCYALHWTDKNPQLLLRIIFPTKRIFWTFNIL